MTDQSAKIIGEAYDKMAGVYATEALADDPGKESRDRFVALLPAGARVLDVGCGAGQDSAGFDLAGLKVYGLDPSVRMIEMAQALVPSGKFEPAGFLQADLAAESFDGVWCSRVFQHVPLAEQTVFIQRLRYVLKPGGRLYLSVKLNGTELDDETWDMVTAGTKTLVKTLGSASWPAILLDNGFKIIELRDWSDKNWVEAYATKLAQ
ncbi:MAG: methyltransferase domain-containing protein [Patescibacteria group bacterium]